jgi:hypothetical protein
MKFRESRPGSPAGGALTPTTRERVGDGYGGVPARARTRLADTSALEVRARLVRANLLSGETRDARDTHAGVGA